MFVVVIAGWCDSDDLYLFLYTCLSVSISNAFLYDLVKTLELHLKNNSFGKAKEK